MSTKAASSSVFTTSNPLLLPIAAIVVTLFFWSSAFVAIRYALHDYHASSLVLLRFLVATVCITPVFLIEKKRKKFAAKRERPTLLSHIALAVAGILGLGVYGITLSIGEEQASASLSSFIISQTPIITTLLAVGFFKEKINKRGIFGIGVSFLGVALIALTTIQDANLGWGVFYVGLAACCAAINFSLQKYLCRFYSATIITCYAIWYSALLLAIFEHQQLLEDFTHASYSTTLVIVYLGLFSTAIAYATWSYALARIETTKVVVWFYAIPLLTTVFDLLFLDETPSLPAFLGGCIAVGGAVILSHSRRKKL